MLFSSITFIGFFLPAVILLYFIIPNRTYKNIVLLVSSLLFYAWGEPKFVFLMMGSILFNYLMGILIEKYERKKLILTTAISINLCILFIFKYLGFTCEIIDGLIESLHIKVLQDINLVMPIGISFYTFQTITYIVDVYRGQVSAQKNILNLGLYITFFPQLIAGPIVRYHDINQQIENRKETIEKISEGLQRFIIGLAKKVLIANNLAIVCDSIYDTDYFAYGTFTAWIAAISYALQIYYDFSGYSDMAIGLAKIFGFNILENFNYPYAAKSVTDFWKRWHISLTNLFRDYVYIPLGGNRKGKKRTMFNRITVFFLTGLWHGAAWHFIAWGLLHGLTMVAERALKLNEKLKGVFSIFYRAFTLMLITIFWVIFRNGIDKTVWRFILKMFGGNYTVFSKSYRPIVDTNLFWFECDTKFFIVITIAIAFCFPWWKKITLPQSPLITNSLSIIKCLVIILLFVLCTAYLANNTYNPFIYFRF